MKKPRWRVSFRHRGVFYALGFFSCRVSFAFGDQLIQLDRSRSQTCTEPAAPILWPSGRILALRGFMALRADFGASRLYGPPGGFWRFAALRLCGRIWISRLFQVFPEEFCSEIQFKFRISGQEFHPDIPVIFVVGNSLEESLIVDGSIL